MVSFSHSSFPNTARLVILCTLHASLSGMLFTMQTTSNLSAVLGLELSPKERSLALPYTHSHSHPPSLSLSLCLSLSLFLSHMLHCFFKHLLEVDCPPSQALCFLIPKRAPNHELSDLQLRTFTKCTDHVKTKSRRWKAWLSWTSTRTRSRLCRSGHVPGCGKDFESAAPATLKHAELWDKCAWIVLCCLFPTHIM